jgi:hypothetical protein
VLTSLFAAVAFLLALTVVTVATGPATAASSCPLGFTPTTGGVAEADTNGDGVTCEVTVDGPMLLATDNGPAAPATATCPDNFTGPFPIGAIFPNIDRNGNQLVCAKEVGSGMLVVIDDNANPHASR